MEQNNQLPENIRLNLKKFDQHREVTCLECGYIGLMGLKNSRVGTVTFWVIMAGLCIFLTIIGFNFLFIFFIALISIIFKRLILGDKVVCPSCEKDLKVR